MQPYFKTNSFFNIFYLFVFFSIVLSCSDSSDEVENDIVDEDNRIVRFFFSENDNPNLTEFISGEINFDNTITVQLSTGADITSLIPSILLSGDATITPDIRQPIDFSEPVDFVITSQSGNNNYYTVEVSLSSKNNIEEFYFKRSENDGLEEDLHGVIDNFNKTILVDLPLAANLRNLTPTFVLDAKNVEDKDDFPNDFFNIKEYEVTADDGSKSTYTISVSYDRHVIIEFGRVNGAFSRMGWSLNTNHNSWRGIEVDEYNRVISLVMNDCVCVNNIIPEIGLLKELRGMSLNRINTGDIITFPKEIGNLSNLENIYLSGMGLDAIPPEIGNLVKLKSLRLARNHFREIPKEIGNLVELKVLTLSGNNITEIPVEMGNLVKLIDFHAYENPIKEIPSSFQNLDNLKTILMTNGDLQIIPKELGNLPKLETLWISSNNISFLPKELSNIRTLTSLQVKNNNLTTIPIEICEMENLYGTSIVIDDNVVCQ